MKEIGTDLKAEQEALDSFLCTLQDSQWDLPTPAEGWTVKDSISHIAHIDEAAVALIGGDNTPLDEAVAVGPSYVDVNARRRRTMQPSEILKWWRDARGTMDACLMSIDPKTRIPWFTLPTGMGGRAFATARLMETWAHGLDCYDAVGVEPLDTDRLRHVAMLAYMARPHAYQVNGLELPDAPLRVELLLPSGKTWKQGPEDASNVIRGTASDFCRVAVRRRHWKDMNLELVGDEAKRFIEIVQAYAGQPGSGRKPKNE